MNNLVTGIAALTTAEGKRIAYTYSQIDDNGTIIKSNEKKSFVVMEQETLDIIAQLKVKVEAHLQATLI